MIPETTPHAGQIQLDEDALASYLRSQLLSALRLAQLPTKEQIATQIEAIHKERQEFLRANPTGFAGRARAFLARVFRVRQGS